MQGSGTFSVEAALGTAIPADGRLLVLANGAYGWRMAQIAERLGIDHEVYDSGESLPPDPGRVAELLQRNPGLTHVALVHCETTTGLLNPARKIGAVVKEHGRVFLLDAMSSFGGIPMDVAEIGADFLISSANKCIQGVPGFGFIIARQTEMEKLAGRARGLSLDMYDQWRIMEEQKGKWRFTSPTHTVRAFLRALEELEEEGGVEARHRRYRANRDLLVAGMRALSFKTFLPDDYQSPIITAFHYSRHPDFSFGRFYRELKERGFVIYPGKITATDTFRIGNIGECHPADIERLLEAVRESMYWLVQD